MDSGEASVSAPVAVLPPELLCLVAARLPLSDAHAFARRTSKRLLRQPLEAHLHDVQAEWLLHHHPEDPLQRATKRATTAPGNAAVVRALLQRLPPDASAGVAHMDDAGEAMARAAAHGDEACVDALLAWGVPADHNDSEAMLRAVRAGHTETVRLLRSQDASSYANNGEALWHAVEQCQFSMLSAVADSTSASTIKAAARAGDLAAAQEAVRRRMHPLVMAARYADMPMLASALAELVEGREHSRHNAAAATLYQGVLGTALEVAALHGHATVIAVLLGTQGIPVTLVGNRALLKAARCSHVAAVRELLRPGVAAAHEGLVPLQWAYGAVQEALEAGIDRGHAGVVELLLAERFVWADALGSDALVRASCEGRASAVELLLSAGVSADARDGEALVMASAGGHISVVQRLLAAGVRADVRDSEALVLASAGGHATVVELLLAAGARAQGIDLLDLDSEVSTRKEHAAVVKLLRTAGARQATLVDTAPVKQR